MVKIDTTKSRRYPPPALCCCIWRPRRPHRHLTGWHACQQRLASIGIVPLTDRILRLYAFVFTCLNRYKISSLAVPKYRSFPPAANGPTQWYKICRSGADPASSALLCQPCHNSFCWPDPIRHPPSCPQVRLRTSPVEHDLIISPGNGRCHPTLIHKQSNTHFTLLIIVYISSRGLTFSAIPERNGTHIAKNTIGLPFHPSADTIRQDGILMTRISSGRSTFPQPQISG